MVSVDPKQIDSVLMLESGVNTVFTLALKGESNTREAMIKELQRHPVHDHVVHVDFVRVDPNKAIHVRVPVRLVGTPEGVRNEGGVIDFIHREVEVECLPGEIPEHLDVDVSELHLNQHVSVGDLSLTERVKLLDDPTQTLAVVVPPRVEEEPVAEEVEEGAEAAAPGEETEQADAEPSAEGSEAGKP